VSSSLFAPEKSFGNTYNGKYHMPLLPGEEGTKSGGDWVPYGLTRMTNLVGAFVESKALGIWQLEQTLFGLVMQPSLYGELSLAVHKALAEGVDLSRMKDFPEFRKLISGTWKDEDTCIAGRARHAAGANEARQAGINQHDAWEQRAKTGSLFGTPEMQEQVLAVEKLLDEAGLERVPGYSERTIRNTELRAAGRFDDILSERSTGRLLMADLKTKRKKFFTWQEVDAQLAGYAYARHMLNKRGDGYEPGPRELGVDLSEGVVLWAPSDGGTPYLRRADLERGWGIAKLCREVMDERAYGKSAAREAESHWPGEKLPAAVDIRTARD
jgi:hypothetical protein